jgi:Spy/CpxP family protein refolding chaperone
MKTIKPFLLTLFVVATTVFLPERSAFSQTNNLPSPSTNQIVRPKRTNPSDLILNRLDKQLSLSAAQREKIKAILDDYRRKTGDIRRQNAGNPAEMTAKLKELRLEEREKIKAQLTDEQKLIYEKTNGPRPRPVQN